MTHMNVVRFIVKPDRINDYLDKLKSQPKWKGQIEGRTIQTGDNTFVAMDYGSLKKQWMLKCKV